MEMTEREVWTADVWRRLQQARRPAPMRNVVERMSAVLAPDPVRFVDNGLEEGLEGRGASGRICVFTDRFVAVADAVGIGSLHAGGTAASQGAVRVVFIPRAALERIEIVPGEPPYVNSGEAWATEQAYRGWPWGGQAALRYRGLDGPVLLPSADPDGFGELLPGLLDDLAGQG